MVAAFTASPLAAFTFPGAACAEIRDYSSRAGTLLAEDHPMTIGVRKFAELAGCGKGSRAAR